MLLLEHLDELDLAANGSAAGNVLSLIDSPDTDAAMLARALTADPALSAKVMALANSAYYGVAGKVGTVQRAVQVVGFGHVRSLAALAAAGVGSGGWSGFLMHAGFLAAASSELASHFGQRRVDAFSAGLLCDVGVYVFSVADAERAAVLRDGGGDVTAECEAFGVDHADLAARLLERWRFPATLVSAVRSHHAEDAAGMAAVLRCADALRRGDGDILAQYAVVDAEDLLRRAWDEAASLSASML